MRLAGRIEAEPPEASGSMRAPDPAEPRLLSEAQVSPRGAFDAALNAFEAASSRAIQCSYSIAGISVRIAWGSEELRSRLGLAIAHLLSEDDVDPRATILVWDGETSPMAPPPFPCRPQDVGARGEVPQASGDGIRTAIFVGSAALSMYDSRRRLGLYWVPDAGTIPWYDCAAPLRTLLHWVAGDHGAALMHAAAVGDDEHGVLVAGRGGSGKSTTALLCLLDGLRYAGDDYVAVTNRQRPVVHGLYATAKVTAETLELVPELGASLAIPPSLEEKAVLDVSRLAPRALATTLPLTAIVSPRIAPGRRNTTVMRASPSKMMLALAPTTMLQLPFNGTDAFESMSNLVRQLPAWIMELGDDTRQIPAAIREVIARSAQ